MCLFCLDINCSKISCKNIKYKRYFLPFILTPLFAIYPEILNFYYFPLVVGFSAFILFWNFPKLVYYTASRPLYYEDLFIDQTKLPNYDVSDDIKNKFQCILEWVLIITNTLLVAGLSDWWLYKINNNFLLFEIIGITGGIIKIFQTINNTISRYMLEILRKQIKKKNLENALKKINNKLVSKNVLEKINFKVIDRDIELTSNSSLDSKKFTPKRGRINTI
tara:strand:+ start:1059 stop:1721 length:663 start_codon:yes stop_codon:yes gene_type:complete